MLPPDISTSLQEFSIRLQSSLPLRHHWEYVKDHAFNVKACVESSVAFQKLRNNVLKTATGQEKDKLAETFRLEVAKLIEAHRMKNEDLKIQAFSVLKKRRDDLYADFESTIERKLQLNPNNLKSTEEFLETGKELMKSYFKYHSNSSSIPGNDGAFNKVQINEEKVLMQELERIGNVLLMQRRDNLKSGFEQEERNLMKEELPSLLKKRMEELCVDFKSTIQTKLLISPEMNLESLKNLMETGKELAKSYFEYHYATFWNTGRYNEDQMKEHELEQQLEKLGNEMLKEQRRHLRSISEEEAKKLLEKLKESVQEMAEKVKADSLEWTQTKYELNLKERIEEIRNHVKENGTAVLSEENNRKIYMELMKLEAGEDMSSADEFIQWTEGLSKEVKHCIECEMETPEMHFFLDSDTDEDVPKVDGIIQLSLGQKTIKEEVVEKEDESSTLDIPQDLDIDIKLELDGVVLRSSCLKPKQTHGPNLEHGNGNLSDSEDVRSPNLQNLIETEKAEKFEAVNAKNVSPSKNEDLQNDDLVDDIQIANMGNQCESLIHETSRHSNMMEQNRVNWDWDDRSNQNLGEKRTRYFEENKVTIAFKRQRTNKTSEEGYVQQQNHRAPTSVNVTESMQIDQSQITDAIPTVISEGKGGGGTQTTKDLELEPKQRPGPSRQLKGINPKRCNVPYKNGDFPLLRAIRNGKDAACIKEMLDAGANVNIKGKVGDNAVHEVITSIIEKRVTTKDALTILKVLMDNGFNLLSDGDRNGITPLHYAMQIKDLDEELVTWLLENGADPNAIVNENKDSVLLHAIALRQGAKIIGKLLKAGANPKHVNKWKQNALHRALILGNQEAFEVFIDKVDVNEGNMYNATSLHFVFVHDDLDHEKCLQLLCEKSANFEIKDSFGNIPSAQWILSSAIKRNIFPTLMKTKDKLGITGNVASDTLRAIVENRSLIVYFSSSVSQEGRNDLVQFVAFLVEEKEAKLPLTIRSEAGWNEKEWRKLVKTIQARKRVGNLMTASIETVLVSLLTCKDYKGFVEVCQYLNNSVKLN